MSSNLYIMGTTKYTKEQVEEAVKASYSISEVLRFFKKGQTGGNHAAMKKRIKTFGIDTSHFLGRGGMKGKVSYIRKNSNQILIHNSKKRRPSYQLTRALIEIGRSHICEECGIGPIHNSKPLTLHVDHINGKWSDNTAENLRFLCPNCHSQTANFGAKNIQKQP